MEQTVYIVDGSSWLYRAYYAIKENLTNREGFPTKVIYGVTRMLLKVLKEERPQYIVVVWDSPLPNFRHKLYSEYKKNRPKMPDDLSIQIPILKDIVVNLGIKTIEIPEAEADDVISSIKHKLDHSIKKVIISLDKDLLQLLDTNTIIFDPMKSEKIDVNYLKEKYNLTPKQFIDYLTLTGDNIDNIPGIPGIGEKTAIKLLSEYGNIENILNNIEKLSDKLKDSLLSHKDVIFLWRELIKLNNQLEVPNDLNNYKLEQINIQTIKEYFTKLDFSSLLSIISDLQNDFTDTKSIISKQKITKQKDKPKENQLKENEYDKLNTIKNIKEFNDLYENLLKNKICYIDVFFANGNTFNKIEKILIGIKLEEQEKLCILEEDFISSNIDQIKKIFSNQEIKIISIAVKNIYLGLLRNDIPFNNQYDDILLMLYILDPEDSKIDLWIKTREKFINYLESLNNIFEFYNELSKKLIENELYDYYKNIELNLLKLLAQMEYYGVLINTDEVKKLSQEWQKEISELEEEIYNIVGYKFNINSSQQLSEVLFKKLNLPSIKKSKKKTIESTDIEVLKELANLHPLPGLIIKYRNLVKLKSTYTEALYDSINQKTGRIHTTFNQTQTATGRLSSINPNLQNIPIKTEEGRKVRRLFIAREGFILLSADYSQIELRVLAHFSHDPNLIKSFQEDKDIHTWTAAQIFDVNEADVTEDMRRTAKTINFGIIYGMSPYGLSKTLNIPTKMASEFIEKYFKNFPKIKEYTQKIIESAREHGYVTTLLGRKRFIPNIKSQNKILKDAAERIAINTPIQGSAADIIKLAMINLQKSLKFNPNEILLLLQVHDELLFEIKIEKYLHYAKMIKMTMENAIEIAVPLKVNIAIGKNWQDLNEIDL